MVPEKIENGILSPIMQSVPDFKLNTCTCNECTVLMRIITTTSTFGVTVGLNSNSCQTSNVWK